MKSESIVRIISSCDKLNHICCAAAKISTTKGAALDIFNSVDENDFQLISKVMGFGHVSFIEHAYYTIAFENVSAFAEQFMIEFRLAAFTVKSRRYVDFSDMGFVVPEFDFKLQNIDIKRIYERHIAWLFGEYSYFMENGLDKEDARFVLPYCYKSNFYCSVNARELIHIIQSCLYGRGKKYKEIFWIGSQLLQQASKISPEIFRDIAAPSGHVAKETMLDDLLGAIKIDADTGNAVELLDYTKDSDIRVASAALCRHFGCSLAAAENVLKTTDVNKVLDIVSTDNRGRELEQAVFTFRLTGLSLACLTHITRHRMQSLLIPSFSEFGIGDGFVVPPAVRGNIKLLRRYKNVFLSNIEMYNNFVKYGVCQNDLVYLFLSGNVLSVLTTMNARELYHFIQLRSCYRAQWEIRDLSVKMLKLVREVSPNLFNRLGPNCFVNGYCSEGNLSCGKFGAVQSEFSNGAN